MTSQHTPSYVGDPARLVIVSVHRGSGVLIEANNTSLYVIYLTGNIIEARAGLRLNPSNRRVSF